MDNVPYPPFTGGFFVVWFAQMEAAFEVNLVSEDLEKYSYTIARIPSAFLSIIQDFILNPPATDVYESFKHEFIKRLTLHQVKVQPFGNEKPSEYLRKLRKIAGGRVDEDVVLIAWRNNLPEHVRRILSLDPSRNTDQMCELADLVMKITNRPLTRAAPYPQAAPSRQAGSSPQETSDDKVKMQARLQALEIRVALIIRRFLLNEHALVELPGLPPNRDPPEER